MNRKMAVKKVSKKATKKFTAKVAAKKAVKKSLPRTPPGYGKSTGGILIPNGRDNVVPPGKLRSGLSAAQDEIRKSLDEIVSVMTQDFEIAETEVSASFSADGKFLGFGVGGAATITVRIRPSDADRSGR